MSVSSLCVYLYFPNTDKESCLSTYQRKNFYWGGYTLVLDLPTSHTSPCEVKFTFKEPTTMVNKKQEICNRYSSLFGIFKGTCHSNCEPAVPSCTGSSVCEVTYTGFQPLEIYNVVSVSLKTEQDRSS